MKRLDTGGSLDARVRRFLLPERIVWKSEKESLVRGAPSLLEAGGGACRLKYDGEAPGILFDFGKEIHGGVRLRQGMPKDHKPVPVRLRFGESIAEAMGTPNQDHAIHDAVIPIPWYGYTEFGNTGFRYLRIDLVEPGSSLLLEELNAVFIYRDLPYRGTFECSDARLNRIWETGAYTVHLCMQDMLWDGIKRDRLVWIGDMHPETMVVNSVFGGVDVVPQSLDFVRDNTPMPQWMNGISSYSIWWLLIQSCWYQYHGNREYLAEQREYLRWLLDKLLGHIGENNAEKLDGHRFLDWPTSEDPSAIHAGLQALLCMGLAEGAAICTVLEESALRKRCLEGAARLRQHTPAPTPSKQANALLALSGLGDAVEVNKHHLAQNPFDGVSTFYGYYVLQARAQAGDYQGALDVIRRYWGAMLDLGATTFWEDFDLGWVEGSAGVDQMVPDGAKSIHADFGNYCYKGLRHSLCHGWAAGPTAWLTEHVLGLSPKTPGCTEVRLHPNLCDLEWAEGRLPTPHGEIHVAHKRRGTETETSVEAPKEVRILRGA